MKTKKAIAKRFTVSRRGKVIKRYCGQDHFNTRDIGKITRKKRRDTCLAETDVKIIKAMM